VDLANYIKFLLYNHDTVNIPDIGTLITRYKHAEINESEKSISPPSKYLAFEVTNTTTDNLLVNHIAEVKQLDKNQAAKELKNIIDDFKNKLNQGETVLLEGIGYFSKENEAIRFEKEQDSNFLTESFGLTKIDYEPIEIEITPHFPQIINTKPRIPYKTILVLSIVIFLVCGGIFLWMNYPDLLSFRTKKINQTGIKPVHDSTLNDTIQNKTARTDTSGKKTDIEEFIESTTNKKNALSIPSPKTEENYKYYIIAGSFQTSAKAELLAKDIEKDGYKTQIVKFGSKYRISLGEYTDKEKALKELEKIRYAKGDNTVWLLTVAP
jgi:nucleoid DNA-binding protein